MKTKASEARTFLAMHQTLHKRDRPACPKHRLVLSRPPNAHPVVHCPKCGWRYQVTT